MRPVLERYRCAELLVPPDVAPNLSPSSGFFRYGSEVVGFGRFTEPTASSARGVLPDAAEQIGRNKGTVVLPFDAHEVVDNLRFERYVDSSGWQSRVQASWVRDVYYRLRPMFPVIFRKYLQRIYLGDWQGIQFPTWPLDRSVDNLLEQVLALTMREQGIDRLPFIWFWPDGHSACAIMTHDVETRVGRDFSAKLMDVDQSYGVPASFQVVPEERYSVPAEYLEEFRARGFELNIHGLNHDGNLFRDRETFLKQAEHINRYATEYQARGFRSPVFYRNIDWLGELNFSYDMSVPNVARLEPQRGGCCTVMPYFLPGGMTELPLTTTEDYTLFHILKDYSTTLWKKQIDMVLQVHGLASFIIHPDYMTNDRAMGVYKELLAELSRLRSDRNVWVALPQDVDRWWRKRDAMRLVTDGSKWRVEGPGSERARVAYACLSGSRLEYEVT